MFDYIAFGTNRSTAAESFRRIDFGMESGTLVSEQLFEWLRLEGRRSVYDA